MQHIVQRDSAAVNKEMNLFFACCLKCLRFRSYLIILLGVALILQSFLVAYLLAGSSQSSPRNIDPPVDSTELELSTATDEDAEICQVCF